MKGLKAIGWIMLIFGVIVSSCYLIIMGMGNKEPKANSPTPPPAQQQQRAERQLQGIFILDSDQVVDRDKDGNQLRYEPGDKFTLEQITKPVKYYLIEEKPIQITEKKKDRVGLTPEIIRLQRSKETEAIAIKVTIMPNGYFK